MQKLLELPKRGLSGFLRRATPAEAAAVLRQTLDEGLLKQLGPFAAVHPYRLEAQVTDLHTLVVSPKPAPGGAESSGQVRLQSNATCPSVHALKWPALLLHERLHAILVGLFVLATDSSLAGGLSV